MDNTKLNTEQRAVIKACKRGKHVFVTGAAGTGKTFLLRRIIQAMRHKYPDKGQVSIVASTGVAAVPLGGTTVHSFAGIGLAQGTKESLALQVRASERARRRWLKCKVLIIDEISQLSAEILEKLEFIARKMKPHLYGGKQTFGGVQVIACGDFFQLPPIALGPTIHYSFEWNLWNKLFVECGKSFVLEESHRHKNTNFFDALNEIRTGNPSETSLQYFSGMCSKYHSSTSCNSLEICGTNSAAKVKNETHLCRLKKQGYEFHSFKAEDKLLNNSGEQAFANSRVPDMLELSVGSRVVLIYNLDFQRKLVNGQQGIVISFKKVYDEGEILPVVQFEVDEGILIETIPFVEFTSTNGEVDIARRTQLPLILGWALTIHKAQGLQFDHLIVDCSGIFDYGQLYVALSRCKDPNRLMLKNFRKIQVKTHPDVLEFWSSLSASIKASKLRRSRKRKWSSSLVSENSMGMRCVEPKQKAKFSSGVIQESPSKLHSDATLETTTIPDTPRLHVANALRKNRFDTKAGSPCIPSHIPETPPHNVSCSLNQQPIPFDNPSQMAVSD